MGALQNQLLQQGLTANDLASVLTAQAQAQAQAQASVNVNNVSQSLGLNTDLGSNLHGNQHSGLGNSVMGNNTMSSGPLSGKL